MVWVVHDAFGEPIRGPTPVVPYQPHEELAFSKSPRFPYPIYRLERNNPFEECYIR
jgi:hypothetical protein